MEIIAIPSLSDRAALGSQTSPFVGKANPMTWCIRHHTGLPLLSNLVGGDLWVSVYEGQ